MSASFPSSFDEVFPRGATPTPFHWHHLGSFVLLEHCPLSVGASDFSRGELNHVMTDDDDPSCNLDKLMVRDCIKVPADAKGRLDANPVHVARLKKLLLARRAEPLDEVVSQPVLWYPGLHEQFVAMSVMDDESRPLGASQCKSPKLPKEDAGTRAILLAASELGLKEVPVYRPVAASEIKQLRQDGLTQMISCGDVDAFCLDNDRQINRRWLEQVVPLKMVCGSDPRHDFIRLRMSEFFLHSVFVRSWESVHAVLDHHQAAGAAGLPLHPQACRHAELGKIFRFIGMTASANDRVDIVMRLHQIIKPMGAETEALFFKGLAEYGRRDPEKDRTFARLAPSVRAWVASQASIKAIDRIKRPHEPQVLVPHIGARS